MSLRFDSDRTGPHTITFPFSGTSSQNPEGDLQLDPHGLLASASYPNQKLQADLPVSFDDLPSDTTLDSFEGLSKDAEDALGVVDEDEEDDALHGEDPAPFSHLRLKAFYQKRLGYYYYRWTKDAEVQNPPPHPIDLMLEVDTVFLHWNPSTKKGRGWKWSSATETDSSVEGWVPLKERSGHVFPHGTYYFIITPTGSPSWVTWSTLRKMQYRDSPSSHGAPSTKRSSKSTRSESPSFPYGKRPPKASTASRIR